MPLNPRLPTLPLAALAALALCGCMMADAAMRADEGPQSCINDADCPRREVCRATNGTGAVAPGSGGQVGICVNTGERSTSQVWLEIRAQAPSTLPPTQFGPVRLADGQNQQILLPPPVTVGGTVYYYDSSPMVGVKKAKVRFQQADGIPGRALGFETQTSEADPVGSFRRQLPAGDYRVTISPPDFETAPAPPERATLNDAPIAMASDLVFAWPVSKADQLVKLTGEVEILAAAGRSPARGVSVWPVDATGRTVAQAALTDQDGSFTLWFPRPQAGTPQVRLAVGPAPGGAPFPEFRLGEEITVNDHKRLESPVQLRDVGEQVTVSGWVLLPGQLQVEGALVTFRTVDSAPFSYTASARTDSGGRFTVSLFPSATYVAVAQPPAGLALPNPRHPEWEATGTATGARWPEEAGLCACSSADSGTDGDRCRTVAGFAGIALSTLEVTGKAISGLQFDCDLPTQRVSAAVIDAAMGGVGAVAVEAVRRPDARLAGEVRLQATTDADGRFEVRLPAGTWDFSLRPSPGSQLPDKRVSNFVVLDADPKRARPYETFMGVIELDPPYELYGRIYSGSTDRPVAATLEAYGLDEDKKPFLVGRGQSAADGSYSLVLPGTR